MSIQEESLALHRKLQGKIEVVARYPVDSQEALSLMYTPGVAEACRVIHRDERESFALTRRSNLVAVITDGTAVLGLGDIGPLAAKPVMEGKCALFKEFGGVDAFPLCIDTKDTDELVRTIYLLSKSFGGINLEDIAAPRCFEVEARLRELCDIPVFHDDQHGTAIVVAAGLLNAVKVAGKTMGQLRIVINGAGAAGNAIAELLLRMGFGSVLLCDRVGILCPGEARLTEAKEALARKTNPEKRRGTLADALRGADVFIGVSGPHLVTTEMVASMDRPIVFAMANPVPEIEPEDAVRGGAVVIGTGRSDLKNQINNVLAFPGIFKGALRAHAPAITEEMKVRAAHAIADMVTAEQRAEGIVIPSALDKSVAEAVARAVEACVK